MPETYVDLHSVSENELVNLRRSRSQGGARQAAADAESIQALPEVAKSRSRVGRRRSQRMDLNCHQPFAIVIIRPNAECDVPGVRRKRLSSAIEKHGAAMSILLPKIQYEMLFVDYPRRRRRSNFSGQE